MPICLCAGLPHSARLTLVLRTWADFTESKYMMFLFPLFAASNVQYLDEHDVVFGVGRSDGMVDMPAMLLHDTIT